MWRVSIRQRTGFRPLRPTKAVSCSHYIVPVCEAGAVLNAAANQDANLKDGTQVSGTGRIAVAKALDREPGTLLDLASG